MKILIATGLYSPEIGGPATHTSILERELPGVGVGVAVAPFAHVRMFPKVIRHIAYCLALVVRSRGAHLIYALDPVSVGLPALIASTIVRKPLVLRVAGDYAWEQAMGRYGTKLLLDQFVAKVEHERFAVRALAFIERFVARRAACVVVPSDYLKRIVTLWGVPALRIQVVHNAFTPSSAKTPRDAARMRFGLSGTVVASAGRMVPWKGFPALIDAVANVRGKYPDVTCLIIGGGPDRDALSEYVKERGFGGFVRFMPPLPQTELRALLSGVDVFALNTAYEGFSHQLLEVMELGIPVVTTDVGGNGELIQHNTTGLFAPYNDADAFSAALSRLIENPALRASLVASAEVHAKTYTTERMLAGIMNVFESTKK